ncbi:hypothetical protein, partial [Enterobacter hormaechei]|uniref:hypothetical protein n=1 Tax=Enterobacter hormaechei TaxID=158836 RepID=UPI001954EF2D
MRRSSWAMRAGGVGKRTVTARIAQLRKTVSLANLARKPLVVLARDQAPLIHDGLLAALRATGADPYV